MQRRGMGVVSTILKHLAVQSNGIQALPECYNRLQEQVFGAYLNPSSTLRWMRRTSLLCLLLLCVSGVAQALHNHSQDLVRGDADKTRCTICVASNSPQQTAATVHVVPMEAREFTVSTRAAVHIERLSGESSRIRPPPSL